MLNCYPNLRLIICEGIMEYVITSTEKKIRVEIFAEMLMNSGFKQVKANTDGFSKPDLIIFPGQKDTYIPDITAWKRRLCIFKVETSESLDEPSIDNEWIGLAEFANKYDASLGIVVPQYALVKANQRVEKLNINARVLEM